MLANFGDRVWRRRYAIWTLPAQMTANTNTSGCPMYQIKVNLGSEQPQMAESQGARGHGQQNFVYELIGALREERDEKVRSN